MPAKRNGAAAVNAALFDRPDRRNFLGRALRRAVSVQDSVIVSDDPAFMKRARPRGRVSFALAALDRAPVEADAVFAVLAPALKSPAGGLIVDMRWVIADPEGITSLERWGAAADRLAVEKRKAVISVYDPDLAIEEQMQAAFRAHRQFLGPSGLARNPFWLPPALLETASRDERLAFMLARAAPDYEGLHLRRKSGEMFARGATPSWLARPPGAIAAGGGARWHIHCFGRLRVFINGRAVEWRVAGSTPKKTRTLFAYLLQSGETGAHAGEISELLWPQEESEAVKRSRLHHTVAMLRKTLLSPDSVTRDGDYYRLNAPPGSWIDIDTFEQLCRRGLALFRKGENDAALRLYLAADRLYAGELFEDLPREYTQSDIGDWCLARRVWLREMALKLRNDMTTALLRLGRTREALDHCLSALGLDPANDDANAGAMRIFAEQGRDEAVQRQYRQYREAVAAVGAPESAEVKALARELSQARRARG